METSTWEYKDPVDLTVPALVNPTLQYHDGWIYVMSGENPDETSFKYNQHSFRFNLQANY